MLYDAFQLTMEFQFQWNWIMGGRNCQNPLQKIKMTIANHKLSTDTQKFCSWRVWKLCKNIEKAWLAHCIQAAVKHVPTFHCMKEPCSMLWPLTHFQCGWWNSWNDKSYALTQKVPFNDDKAHTHTTTTTKNKQQPNIIIQSLFDEIHTNKRTNNQTTTNLDDDGEQNFAVLFKHLTVIVKVYILWFLDIEYQQKDLTRNWPHISVFYASK